MNHRICSIFGSVLATTGLSILASTAVHAQSTPSGVQTGTSDTGSNSGGLEEIVVTAQRREEKMVDVPISVTSLSAQQLTTANVQNLSDIAQLTPSLRFNNQTGFFQPSIRGIGTAITTSGGGSNVGIYLDGFYSPNPVAADMQLLGVTNVQVLKGPQGTLFGYNTTGGAILVTTAEPSTDTHGEAKIAYGSFNSQRFQGYATTGLGDGIAADVQAIMTKGNGFLTNIVNDDDHVGAYENYTIRGGLKFEIGDRVSVLARYTHEGENDPTAELTNSNVDSTINPTTGKVWGVQTYAVPGLYTTNPNQVANSQPGLITSQNNIIQLTVKADLDFADLTSHSQYRDEKTNQSEALGQTAFPIFQLGLPIADITESQELLLTSKPGNALQWTAGTFFFSNRDTWQTYINTAGDSPAEAGPSSRLGGSGTETVSFAEFLDGTYELVPNKLFITAGVRLSHDIVENAYYNPQGQVGLNPNAQINVPSIDSNKLTPRVVVRYKPTDQSSVYASFSEGYKAAIIDVGGSCQDGPAYKCNPIQPESVDAYEVGYKFESHGFSNEAAAYYYNYKNLQVSEFLGNAQAYIVNAAQSKIWGFEDTIHYDLGTHVQMNGGASYTHARYVTFGGVVNGQNVGAPIYATCPSAEAKYASSCTPGTYAYVNTDTVLHNVPMQNVPTWTATIGPRFTTGQVATGEYSIAGNFYYSSSLYYSPSGTQFLQPSYATLGLRAEWDDPSNRYMVALYGDNLTNDRYRTQVQYNSFGIGASWNAPATWGVEFGVKF